MTFWEWFTPCALFVSGLLFGIGCTLEWAERKLTGQTGALETELEALRSVHEMSAAAWEAHGKLHEAETEYARPTRCPPPS